MTRRILTVAAVALFALPLGTAAHATGPADCTPPDYAGCTRPVWCDGTGYGCDATGLLQWQLDKLGVAVG